MWLIEEVVSPMSIACSDLYQLVITNIFVIFSMHHVQDSAKLNYSIVQGSVESSL